MANPSRLGKGLSALMEDDYSEFAASDTAASRTGLKEIPLDALQSGKFQPRSRFDQQHLQELADSISKSGVMQPIVIRPVDGTNGVKYEIIAGERRWRAAKMAGEYSIPAIIRDISDQQALELALVENIQRKDLSPLEEAIGFQRLMDEFSYTQEELAATVGKSRSHVANLVRLLNLPPEVKELLDKGDLTMGHARALMGVEDPHAIAQEIIRRGLNVRQTENLARAGLPKQDRQPRQPRRPGAEAAAKDADIVALEQTLSDQLGLQVSIDDVGQQGQIVIAYNSLEQLDEILRRLGGVA